MYYDTALSANEVKMYQQQQIGSTASVNRMDMGFGTPPDSPNPSVRGSIDERRGAPSPLASPNADAFHQQQQQHLYDPNSPMAGSNMPSSYHRRFENNGNLAAPEDDSRRRSARSSGESFYDDDHPDQQRRPQHGAVVPPLYYDGDRSPSADVNPARGKGSKFYLRDGDGYQPGHNDIYEDDENSERYPSGQSSDMGDSTAVGQSQPRAAVGGAHAYDNFLAAANRQIAKQSKGVRDPFLEHRQSMDSLSGSPNRPFTTHSRNSSFDSISSIMDEKGSSSPLNKAIVDVSFIGEAKAASDKD
jgi:alpha-1,3-glucan synthase